MQSILCEQKEKDVDNNIVQAETQVLKSPVKVKNIFPRPAVSTYKPGSEPHGLNFRSYETYKSPFSPCAPSELHFINLTACLTFFWGGTPQRYFQNPMSTLNSWSSPQRKVSLGFLQHSLAQRTASLNVPCHNSESLEPFLALPFLSIQCLQIL